MVAVAVYGGSVELCDDALTLTWKGISSSREQRKASPHRIELSDVRSVQAHEPGKLSNGWVRFGPDALGKVGSQPPKDLYSIVFTRNDDGYGDLLALTSAVCAVAGVANPLPEPVQTASGVAGDPGGKWAGLRPDIAAAANRLTWSFGGKREIKKLAEHLLDGEEVEELAQGTFAQSQGIVALTSQRLFFLFHGLVSQRTEEFGLESITAVEISKALNQGTLRLRMSGNACEITNVISKDLDRMAGAIRRRIGPSAPPASSTAVADDPLALIRRLGELRDAGLLSPEEYDAKKQELLERV